MPSPSDSPVASNSSPSAIRNSARQFMSPPPPVDEDLNEEDEIVFNTHIQPPPRGQWRITHLNNNSNQEDDPMVLDDFEVQEEFIEQQQERVNNSTRRSLLSVMRNMAGSDGPGSIPLPNSRTSTRRSRQSQNVQTQADTFNSFLMQFPNNGGAGFEAIANNINRTQQQQPVQTNTTTTTTNITNLSPLRNKIVYTLRCRYCENKVCNRAMKAILLADTKIELYSTDIPPTNLYLLNEDRLTHGCHCRIRDTACLGCGNVLGYHVSQPCERCLDAKNNGHFWMYYSETVRAGERMDPMGNGKPVYWGSLAPMRDGEDPILMEMRRYEMYCR